MTDIKGYKLTEKSRIKDINGTGAVYEHEGTGAKVAVLSNDDTELAMTVAFRTPPVGNNGLTHIIEHSVFCGSQKYPLKDPFVELMKGSMYTYLNAVTYGDMTVFPVASTNGEDFDNLMDVYLDAVFKPLLAGNKAVFMQEGWHYSEDGSIGGVVLGEMRGLVDDPDFIMNNCLKEQLYPDSPYRFVSGGRPEEIVGLTYDEVCRYYMEHYHPSNCIVILYGKMDAGQKLSYIAENYFDKYERKRADYVMPVQKSFSERKEAECRYPVSDSKSMSKGTYYAYVSVVGDNHDGMLSLTMQILNYVLCMAPGAYLHEAFMDRGVGEDLDILMDDQMRQPYYGFLCSYCRPDEKDIFTDIIESTLLSLVKKGIDKEMLRAALKTTEFNYREADFGGIPKGIVYGDMLLEKMIFDEPDPLQRLKYSDVIEKMYSLIETDYFERFIEEKILNNPHKVIITMSPDLNMSRDTAGDFDNKVRRLYEDGDKEQIRKDVALYTKYSSLSDDEYIKKCIPIISGINLAEDKRYVPTELIDFDGVNMMFQNRNTHGIGYLNLGFDLDVLGKNKLQYVRLLVELLGLVDTDNYSYTELSKVADSHTGGIFNYVAVADGETIQGSVRPMLVQRTGFMYDEAETACRLNTEILLHSLFDNEAYIGELLLQLKSVYAGSFTSAPNAVAADIARSMCSKASGVHECIQGYDFYGFLCGIIDDYKKNSAGIRAALTDVLKKLICTDNMTIMFVGEKEHIDDVMPHIRELVRTLSEDKSFTKVKSKINFKPFQAQNLAYTIPAQVNNVVLCGTIGGMARNDRGHMLVLEHILNCGYLWQKVRVEGGAYGCSAEFSYNGTILFESCSDPHVGRTIQIFRSVADYVRNIEIGPREMKQYIIGTMNDLDMPMMPEAEGMARINLDLSGMTHEDTLRIRKQIIETTADDIRSLAPYFYEMLRNAHVVVVGSSDAIDKNRGLFDTIRPLM